MMQRREIFFQKSPELATNFGSGYEYTYVQQSVAVFSQRLRCFGGWLLGRIIKAFVLV